MQKVAVIGQGYVGLPLSMSTVDAGFKVVGIDYDQNRVDGLNSGISHVEDISNELLQDALDSGRYSASSSYEAIANFDYAVVSVPTPLKETLPDLSFIEAAAKEISPYISEGATIILESTTYPGTTEELFVSLLESGNSLKAGKDFHVGYSPERIDPGNKKFNFRNTPKVVSGIDSESLARVDDFFSKIVDTTVKVTSPKEAEMAKLLENTFRHVNIALINELAVFGHELGVNIWESIEAAATKPFGFMKFTPGPGVGGHCLPIDPSYLSWKVKTELGQPFRFVELANEVNDNMPNYVLQRIIYLLNDLGKPLKNSNILLLGVSYKKDSGDLRESPALKIIDLLNSFGVNVFAIDNYVEDHRWPRNVKRVRDIDEDILSISDMIVVITDHSTIDYDQVEASSTPVFDTRNALSGKNIYRL